MRHGKIGRLPASLCGTVLLILLASGARPQEEQKKAPLGKDLPEGLRHVPPEAMAFVYIRSGDLLQSPLGKLLKRQLAGDRETSGALNKLERELGMPLADLESITVVMLDAPARGKDDRPAGNQVYPTQKKIMPPFDKKPIFEEKGKIPFTPKEDFEPKKTEPGDKEETFDGLSPVGLHDDAHFEEGMVGPWGTVIIVTGSKSLDRKKLLQRFVIREGERGQSMLFLSERSFVIGAAQAIMHFAAVEAKDAGKNPKDSLAGALAVGDESHVLVAGFRLPEARKRQLVAQIMDSHSGPEVTLFPLVNVTWARATLDLENGAHLNVQLRGKNERSAALAAEAAKAGLALLELGMDKMSRNNEAEGPATRDWFKALRESLAGAKVSREGLLVRAQLHAELDPKVIATAIGEITGQVKLSGSRRMSMNNLKQIALAMHSYHDAFGGLPPPALADAQGKPLLSWRVAILPFIEQENLYRQFKLDETWDSAHNKKLIAQMPAIYADPRGKKGEAGLTYYQVFVGPGTAFEPLNPGKGKRLANIRFQQIPDGTSNTLMAVEAGTPVIWTRPDDVAFEPKIALPKLGGLFPDGFHAAFCDGSVRFIRRTVPEATLRLLIIRNDGMVIPPY